MFRGLAYATILLILSFGPSFAHSNDLADIDYFKIAEEIESDGNTDVANQMFYRLLHSSDKNVSMDSAYKLAVAAMNAEDFKTASLYYRWMLQQNPDLPRIRFELALCYIKMKRWNAADYQLRLALSANDIPEVMQQVMLQYRYLIRQNKNWNVWFNFGAAPDNNINQTTGGEECITTVFGTLCRQLPKPVSAVGYNLTLGGNYEFKLSDHWRWKNNANIYTNVYNLHDYDDLYLSVGTGPRYVWSRGDVWVAGIASRRWYGWDGYNWSYGAKTDVNYDFTRKLSGGLSLRLMNNIYDDFGAYMNGQTYSVYPRLSYSLDATKYIILRGGLEREIANDNIYSNWRPSVGVGFGAELPFGFHVYIEPNFSWANYDGARWVVDNNDFTEKCERDFIQRYAISISNNKLDIWGFVPTVTLSYTKRDSNIWQREYNKTAVEFTMQQRF